MHGVVWSGEFEDGDVDASMMNVASNAKGDETQAWG